MKYLFALLLLLFTSTIFCQEDKPKGDNIKRDSTDLPIEPNKNLKRELTNDSILGLTIEDYKIISFERDTTFLDTTLTIQKEYKYNYLRKDDFELMPFSNTGQAYNKLGVNLNRRDLYPKLGAKAKHYNYLEIEDIDYYNVPTPMTDLFFKTTLEQGQLLDAMLTFNTSRRLNFSLAYKGHRSLGKYQFDQILSGNFRTTVNYQTKNERYLIRAHIAAQNIDSQENGGLTDKELQFESGDEDFRNRPRVDVRFDDADNKVLGKRYYLDHQYKLIRKRKDSSYVEKTSLAIGHAFNYETKFYQFLQDNSNEYFGESVLSSIDDKASLKTFYNQFNVQFYNKTLGLIRANANMYNYNYAFNSIFITGEGQTIQNQLKGTEIALGGDYIKRIGDFDIQGSLKYNLSGELTGNILDASASYMIKDKHKVELSVHSSSRMPNFNFLLYQSEYLNYNWQNTDTFEKENTNSFRLDIDSSVWGQLSIDYQTINNYTYFGSDTSVLIEENREQANIRPFQQASAISYLKAKYSKEFRLGKFALNNKVMYQNVSQDNNALNVPQLVTRNTLYFSSDVFNKAMYLQTGITFKYFTSYTMDAYSPLLGEFYVQNDEEHGGFPLLDFFINARVKQTRIYLKAEHFNSSFTGYDFYAAPNYPYRDFVIRFGLVWNFFS
ncbi:putative porin [Maribacter sp. 2210JD10-5]|uniref:putative porin n=1 Tax=Maribacter sp. 2210JD10-5 TaxID=3386272 RepID=UPI0039BD913C